MVYYKLQKSFPCIFGTTQGCTQDLLEGVSKQLRAKYVVTMPTFGPPNSITNRLLDSIKGFSKETQGKTQV